MIKSNLIIAGLVADRLGCLLEVSYDRVKGYKLLLWAPDGMAFSRMGESDSADLAGQGCKRSDMDWAKTIEDIEKTVAEGFVKSRDDE